MDRTEGLIADLAEDFAKAISHGKAVKAMRRAAFDMPQGMDPANAQIYHMVNPRDSEVAILMAAHANWARRETIKALRLASMDAARASDAAGRANAAVMEALRQPSAKFTIYQERPLPMEPWFAGKAGGPLRGLLRSDSPRGIHLQRLADWFEKHPGPPTPPEVQRIEVLREPEPPPTKGPSNAKASESESSKNKDAAASDKQGAASLPKTASEASATPVVSFIQAFHASGKTDSKLRRRHQASRRYLYISFL